MYQYEALKIIFRPSYTRMKLSINVYSYKNSYRVIQIIFKTQYVTIEKDTQKINLNWATWQHCNLMKQVLYRKSKCYKDRICVKISIVAKCTIFFLNLTKPGKLMGFISSDGLIGKLFTIFEIQKMKVWYTGCSIIPINLEERYSTVSNYWTSCIFPN